MTTGIMGGTFDPIHLGHLQIARTALQELNLDRVLFLPDGDPPHKVPLSRPEDRLNMVRLACAGEPRCEVSDMELRRGGRTYTVDSLTHLKEKNPGDELCYLVGSDTFFLFPTWRTAEQVARMCSMAVVMRPGDEDSEVRAAQADFLLRYGLKSHLLRGRGLNISSSLVREALKDKKDIAGLVPANVAEYIRQYRLYAA